MTPSETKKALLAAGRAYDRARRATSCSLATTHLRHGRQQETRAREGVREHVRNVKRTFKYDPTPVQRELSELDQQLPHAEFEAHLNRLDRCGITQAQHEQRVVADRSRDADAVDKARERQYRKRPKKKPK